MYVFTRGILIGWLFRIWAKHKGLWKHSQCLPSTVSLKLSRSCEHGTTTVAAQSVETKMERPSTHPTRLYCNRTDWRHVYSLEKQQKDKRGSAALHKHSCLWTSTDTDWQPLYLILKSPSSISTQSLPRRTHQTTHFEGAKCGGTCVIVLIIEPRWKSFCPCNPLKIDTALCSAVVCVAVKVD